MRRGFAAALAAMLMGGLIVGFSGGVSSPAFAKHTCPPPGHAKASYPPDNCKAKTNKNTVAQCGFITISGSGFAAGARVNVKLDNSTFIGSGAAGPNGNFKQTVQIPCNTKIGPHTLVLTGHDSDGDLRYLTTKITVTPFKVGRAFVNDSSPTPGQNVTVSGNGFKPNTPVSIDLHSTVVHLATVNSSSTGTVSKVVKIPSSTKTGTHTITLTGALPNGATQVLSVNVTVHKASSFSALPRTGAVLFPMLGGGLGLVAVGSVLIAAGRRRRGQTLA